MDSFLEEEFRIISRRPKERLSRLRSLGLSERSVIVQALTPSVQQTVLDKMKVDEVADVLDHLDPRQAEVILSRIKNEKRRLQIIRRIKSEAREKIEYFLRFHPKATTDLISLNYVLLSNRSTIGETATAIEEHFADTGKFPEVLVQENGTLIGEVLMPTLVRERNTAFLQKYVTPVTTVSYQNEVVDIINILTTSERKKVVVLDHDQSVLGVIYGDDAMSLFGKMPAESLYNVSGLDSSARPFDTVRKKFENRYRWLILNLATAFLAGSMIFIFKDTLDRLVVLAMYIPIVAGMGGNAASQVFAVMLRGMTLGTISFKSGMPAIWLEVKTGFVNGILIGLIVAVISVLWNHSAMLGLVVGLSMVGVHVVAGFFGAFVPLFLKHIGKDPASTSTIFITTATDVLGLFFLLGLGTLILL